MCLSDEYTQINSLPDEYETFLNQTGIDMEYIINQPVWNLETFLAAAKTAVAWAVPGCEAVTYAPAACAAAWAAAAVHWEKGWK